MSKMTHRTLAAFAVLLVPAAAELALAQPAAAPEPAPFSGVPNVERIYYDVSGRSVQAIRSAINGHANRPRDPNDGQRTDALATWYMRWSWPGDGHGGCDLAGVRIEFSARVTLPRLIDQVSVPAPVLRRWRAYLAALERHEDGHIRYAFEHMGEVLAAMRASSCERVNADAEAAVRRIGQHDIDYDRETRHGAAQGARFP